MDRIDIWLSDKKAPTRKVTKNGTNVMEFYGSWQSEAYDAWLGAGKNGTAPERYVYVNVSVFDEGLMAHVEKIHAKVIPWPRQRHLRQDRLRREAIDANRSRGGIRALPRRSRLFEIGRAHV